MTAFGELHRAGEPLLLPNAWDFASAAALVEAGFAAIGTTSLGVATASGVPDAQGRARAETLALARRLRPLPCLLTERIRALVAAVDAPVNILFAPGRHTVRDLADLGVARVSTGSLLFRAALGATVATARAFAAGGDIPPAPTYSDIVRLTDR